MTESKLRVSLMPTPPEGVELPDKPRATFRWVSTAIVIALVWWSATGIDAKWSRLLEAPGDMWTLCRVMFSNMEASDIPELVAAMWESIAIAWLGSDYPLVGYSQFERPCTDNWTNYDTAFDGF